jgi:hypothetical protein
MGFGKKILSGNILFPLQWSTPDWRLEKNMQLLATTNAELNFLYKEFFGK